MNLLMESEGPHCLGRLFREPVFHGDSECSLAFCSVTASRSMCRALFPEMVRLYDMIRRDIA